MVNPSSNFSRHQIPSYPSNFMDQFRQNQISRARKITLHSIYQYLMKWFHNRYGERVHVLEVVKAIEDALFNNAATLGEYLNANTLRSRIEVQLGHLTHHSRESLKCNVASTNITEPTLNGLPFMSSTFGGCNESNIRRFPHQMINEYNTTPVYDQSNMISNSLVGGGVQSEPLTQRVNSLNITDVPLCSRDQASQLQNYSVMGVPVIINSNMDHVYGSYMPDRKFIQTAPNELDPLHFGQHHQTGDRSEPCATAPSIHENHYGSINSLVQANSDCSGNSSSMHMHCQSNLKTGIMPSYFGLPRPGEAVATQTQVLDQTRHANCSLPLSDTSGRLMSSDVHLNSQRQPQQVIAMLEKTTSGIGVNGDNGHMQVNEMIFRNSPEYQIKSEFQHLANKNAPPLQALHHDQSSQESESGYKYPNVGIEPHTVANQNLQVPTEKHGMPSEPSLSMLDARTTKDFNVESNIRKKRQLFILGWVHAHLCNFSAERICPFPNCINLKKLLQHIANCNADSCSTPQCRDARCLIAHFNKCSNCPVCLFIKRKFSQANIQFGTPFGMNRVHCNTSVSSTVETCEDPQSPLKRVKIDVSEVCIPTTKTPRSGVSTNCASHLVERPLNSNDQCKISLPANKPELPKLNDAFHEESSFASQRDSDKRSWARDNTSVETSENVTQVNLRQEEPPRTSSVHVVLSADSVTESAAHTKVDCVSLTELFTPEQVRQHILSLRQRVGQRKVIADKTQSMEQSVNQNSCQLCAAGELIFEPVPVYCSQCYSRIKRNAVYYMLGTWDTQYYFCTTCHTALRGKKSIICGVTSSKCDLVKKKNTGNIQEPWVQCDKCQSWQHQICALFNIRMNGEGSARYTCPYCYVKEIERGDRFTLPRTGFLGAKDLPRTTLSDHIEKRLYRSLHDSKVERAATQGSIDEKFPGGADLVIRVVLSVDKKLEVKKNFLGVFHEYDYPAEFTYKSKVILLFQYIEGVEVCLFGMYVQEYGSECDFPNRRRVYISYLDSVKYFRPDVKLMTEECLRTFVYHEVLIGYLDYCKTRGFTSCYIWVCPPLKDEDYILYCHPESQRTPKKDKLREWYSSMLRKAMEEDIVVEITNIYDHFFISTGESKAKITATRLPYFDGDHWPGNAEEKLQQFGKYSDKTPIKKSATKKSSKKSLQATLDSDISDSEAKDMFLMREMGKIIYPMKEDFIMVHLQHACTHCRMFIISGNRWLCRECRNFQLCDKCYEAEQCRDEHDRHPLKKAVKHLFHHIKISDIPSDTSDVDGNIENAIFDTRQEFLGLCQRNHYQYDTLRRAKHSSMMLLYHLHNPAAPSFVSATSCKICNLDIEPGQGFLCEVCFAYEICDLCEKHGEISHHHKLMRRSSSTRNKDARALCDSWVRKLNGLIVHVSDCYSPSCTYADCRKMKWLFHHATQCTKRVLNGCVACKKMWYLIQIHSRECFASKCCVPRCSDLKMHSRSMRQQAEARGRGAAPERKP